MQKGFSTIILLLGLFIVMALGGAYYLGQQSTNIIQPTSIVNNPSPTPDPTADWKTFTNQQLNISFKYPPFMKDPQVNLLSTRIQILTDEFTIESGSFYDQSLQRNLTFDEYIKKNSLNDNNISDYTIGGINGKKIINKTQEIIAVQPSNSRPDNILIIYFKLEAHPGVQNEFINSILKTFKFTDQTSTADTSSWKTYTDKGIYFKYPSGWNLSSNNTVITSSSPKIEIDIVGNNETLMNECMKKVSEETINSLIVTRYTKVITGAMCGGTDPNPRQIWIIPSKNAYSPGINYQYSATESKQAEDTFDQILSTFKFTN